MWDKLKWLFCWEGRVTRVQYFLAGISFVMLKFLVDYAAARHFGESWRIWYYFLPPSQAAAFAWGKTEPEFYAVLWLLAIPFFWIGITLTLRRLRDAGESLGLIFLFFLPLLNLVFFTWMSIAPTNASALPLETPPIRQTPQRPIAVAMGVILTVAFGSLVVYIGAGKLAQYAWGLFLGVPFTLGFASSWFLNVHQLHSRSQTIGISVLTTFCTGMALFGMRLEGLVCLAMALPLALPFAMAGGLLAWYMLRCGSRQTSPTLAAWVFVLPLAMLGEHAARLQPPVLPIVSSVVVNAPPAIVWKDVIAFSPLAPPKEFLFHTGIAYPKSATIVGTGVGATRYCRFSTGDFVEPITTWDEERLLAFNVAGQPPSMRELSPWNISPPHLERSYMRSQRGQFRLIPLDGNRTLLEGTTWYQDYFWPQPYWRAFSDYIVHRIHMQVLEHVKDEAEGEYRAARR